MGKLRKPITMLIVIIMGFESEMVQGGNSMSKPIKPKYGLSSQAMPILSPGQPPVYSNPPFQPPLIHKEHPVQTLGNVFSKPLPPKNSEYGLSSQAVPILSPDHPQVNSNPPFQPPPVHKAHLAHTLGNVFSKPLPPKKSEYGLSSQPAPKLSPDQPPVYQNPPFQPLPINKAHPVQTSPSVPVNT